MAKLATNHDGKVSEAEYRIYDSLDAMAGSSGRVAPQAL